LLVHRTYTTFDAVFVRLRIGFSGSLQEAASFPCLYHGSPPPPLSVGKVGS